MIIRIAFRFIPAALLSLSLIVQAQAVRFSTLYKPGSKLYVATPSGLNLRTRPDVNGAALKVLPYGAALTVVTDQLPRTAFINSNIAGDWVKVQSDAQTGYVFDGFLTRIEPMALGQDKDPLGLPGYLKMLFKVDRETDQAPDTTYLAYQKIEFVNGAVYLTQGYVGGSAELVFMPRHVATFKEVYLMARVAYPEFFASNACPYSDGKMDCSVNENTNLRIWNESGGTQMVLGIAD